MTTGIDVGQAGWILITPTRSWRQVNDPLAKGVWVD